MNKRAFLKSDWFLGAVIALILAVAVRGDLIQSLERRAYDLRVNAVTRTPSDKIAVIAVDDQSISSIVPWPWSRDIHAKMTDVLAAAQARVIVNAIFFLEPQIYAAPVALFGALLREAELALNTDRKPAESFRSAGNVLLPMVFQSLTEPRGNPDKTLSDYVLANSLALDARAADLLIPGIDLLYPMPALGSVVAGIARITDTSKTRAGTVLGTPSYMSRERLAGMKIEGRSDLSPLGAARYQMCCGYLPFTGVTMAQLMYKIPSEPHTDILTYNPTLPVHLVAVINRALAKQPDGRFQAGDEMAKALREWIGIAKPVQP